MQDAECGDVMLRWHQCSIGAIRALCAELLWWCVLLWGCSKAKGRHRTAPPNHVSYDIHDANFGGCTIQRLCKCAAHTVRRRVQCGRLLPLLVPVSVHAGRWRTVLATSFRPLTQVAGGMQFASDGAVQARYCHCHTAWCSGYNMHRCSLAPTSTTRNSHAVMLLAVLKPYSAEHSKSKWRTTTPHAAACGDRT